MDKRFVLVTGWDDLSISGSLLSWTLASSVSWPHFLLPGDTGREWVKCPFKHGNARCEAFSLPWVHSALFSEQHKSYYLSHFLVKHQQRPCHSAPGVNIFSGCERSQAAFPNPVITAVQFTAVFAFISVLHRKRERACFITSSNNQPVRRSKQYDRVDVSV